MSGESLIFYDEWEGITKKSYEISIDDSFDDKLIGILNKYKYCVEDRELEEGTDSMSGFASYFLVYVNGDEEGYYVVWCYDNNSDYDFYRIYDENLNLIYNSKFLYYEKEVVHVYNNKIYVMKDLTKINNVLTRLMNENKINEYIINHSN